MKFASTASVTAAINAVEKSGMKCLCECLAGDIMVSMNVQRSEYPMKKRKKSLSAKMTTTILEMLSPCVVEDGELKKYVVEDDGIFAIPETAIAVTSNVKLYGGVKNLAFDRYAAEEVHIHKNLDWDRSKNGLLDYKGYETMVYANQAYVVDPEHPTLQSQNGAILSKDGKILYRVPIGISHFEVPSTVEEIFSHAFSNCQVLKEVEISSGVRKIGRFAFASCLLLKELVIPEGVREIAYNAFAGNNLCWLTLPSTAVDLEFYKCISSRPRNHIFVSEDNPVYSSYNGALFNKEKTRLFVVPRESGLFLTIPDTVQVLEEGCFEGNRVIRYLEIPKTVKRIERGAFQDCRCLEKVELREGLEYIGEDAFRYCVELEIPEIPHSVKELGENALEVCRSHFADDGNFPDVEIINMIFA